MKRTTEKGFTLLELMIVMAIISILASLALPAYAKYIKRAKFSEVIGLTAGIKLAVEICHFENNSLIPCDDNTAGRGSSSHPEVTAVRSSALNATYVSHIDVVYFNPTRLTIEMAGSDAVDNATYHLQATVNSHDVITWRLDATSSDCDDRDFC